jgi:hypothetical protein
MTNCGCSSGIQCPESGTVMPVTFAANGCVELSPKLPDLGLFGRFVNHMPGFNHFIILNAVYTYAPVINFFFCLLIV